MMTETGKREEMVMESSTPFSSKKPRINLTTLLYYGKPKTGKSTMLSQLANNLIISTERNGAAFLKGVEVYDCTTILKRDIKDVVSLLKHKPATNGTMVLDLGDMMNPVEQQMAVDLILNTLIQLGRPFDYVSIDTLTQIDGNAEWVGTEKYMNSTQGKQFNVEKTLPGSRTPGKTYKYGDEEYESVNTLPQGFGYRWSRSVMVDFLNLSRQASNKCTIYVCHVKDKLVGKGDKGEVFIKDLSLTGAVADIYSRQVDALASIWNDEGELKISFKGSEEKSGGTRGADHIVGYEGPFEWSKIFIEE